jgi:LmbE family N-acetylglucosaminyl deacetylase
VNRPRADNEDRLVLRLTFQGGSPLRVLAIGAHPDDIEIGCGGTLLRLVAEGRVAEATWVVMSGEGSRRDEARIGAEAILTGVGTVDLRIEGFRDGYFPASYAPIKDVLEGLTPLRPDLVLVPRRDDAHQDHRLLGELAGTVFRDHLVLEYEVPKSDGDLGPMNLFVDLAAAIVERKIEALGGAFPSQRHRAWFTPETFRALMRLRGVEARTGSGYAEAFVSRKAVV